MSVNALTANYVYNPYQTSNGYEIKNYDSSQWQLATTATDNATSATLVETSTQTSDILSTDHTDGCTDGKDDGKIGLFQGLWNGIKGVAKGAANMVVGAFTKTDENGKRHFSLGKTLLTVGTAALCTVCPAVGLALCGVGAVTGAIGIGKGIYKAATAKTDAEAKSAWQSIGSNGLQVGVSIFGAKASMKAVKSTSTAGANGGSALDSLSKDASITAKGKALWADCKSSTANNFGKITSTISMKKAQKEAANEWEANSFSKENMLKEGLEEQLADGQISPEEYQAALKEAGLDNPKVSTGEKVKGIINDARSKVKDSSAYKNVTNAAKHPVETLKNLKTKISTHEGKTSISSVAKSLSTKGQTILKAMTDSNASYNQLVAKYGYQDVTNVLNIIATLDTTDANLSAGGTTSTVNNQTTGGTTTVTTTQYDPNLYMTGYYN